MICHWKSILQHSLRLMHFSSRKIWILMVKYINKTIYSLNYMLFTTLEKETLLWQWDNSRKTYVNLQERKIYIITLLQATSASKLIGIPSTADLFVSSESVTASHSVRAFISFLSFRDNFKHFSSSCFFSVTCRRRNKIF